MLVTFQFEDHTDTGQKLALKQLDDLFGGCGAEQKLIRYDRTVLKFNYIIQLFQL